MTVTLVILIVCLTNMALSLMDFVGTGKRVRRLEKRIEDLEHSRTDEP